MRPLIPILLPFLLLLSPACSTTSEGYSPRPEITLRDDLRQACPHPAPPSVTEGAWERFLQAMAQGDWQAAVTHAEAVQANYGSVSVFSLSAAETIHCERGRRAETISLIDQANATH
jgi:hypothetical protein